MGIRRELIEKGTEIAVKEKRITVKYVSSYKKKWRIVGIYVNGDIEQKLRKMRHWMDGGRRGQKEDGVKAIIGRDFNARTEEEGR